MQKTLMLIRDAAGQGPQRYADIIKSRLPDDPEDRDRYLGELGEFLAQAMDGLVIDPEGWVPPR